MKHSPPLSLFISSLHITVANVCSSAAFVIISECSIKHRPVIHQQFPSELPIDRCLQYRDDDRVRVECWFANFISFDLAKLQVYNLSLRHYSKEILRKGWLCWHQANASLCKDVNGMTDGANLQRWMQRVTQKKMKFLSFDTSPFADATWPIQGWRWLGVNYPISVCNSLIWL